MWHTATFELCSQIQMPNGTLLAVNDPGSMSKKVFPNHFATKLSRCSPISFQFIMPVCWAPDLFNQLARGLSILSYGFICFQYLHYFYSLAMATTARDPAIMGNHRKEKQPASQNSCSLSGKEISFFRLFQIPHQTFLTQKDDQQR